VSSGIEGTVEEPIGSSSIFVIIYQGQAQGRLVVAFEQSLMAAHNHLLRGAP